MSAPWFHCQRIAPGVVELDERERRHALTVLRLEPPAEITLFDGAGRVASAALQWAPLPAGKRRKDAAIELIASSVEDHPRATPALSLIVAACKGPRLDTLVEKCTELGVSRLFLASFARSIVRLERRQAEKLRDTAIAACKQSRNPWLPAIETGLTLVETLDRAAGSACVAAHLDAGAEPAVHIVSELIGAGANTAVIIGPEGGIAPDEVELLRQRGTRLATLGPQVLRVETAAVAAAALWHAHRACGA